MSNAIHTILRQYWGFDSFRPLQEDIIQSVLNGHDTLALMPTGGGKSLCYQVPAMAMDGMCLVISPLIALMKDQVENLRKKGITAYSIFSGMSRKEVVNILTVVTESNCKFLYVSPERLETALFKEYLPGMGISLIAVDEAHCISQWGYDFRPPYLRIAALRDELPTVPVLALTASATPDVQKDICEKLQFSNPKIFRQSFERPNLSYSVFKVDSRINKLLEVLNKVPGTAIIYCKSRKRTKEISEVLQLQHIAADYYHAGLTQEERNNKQEAWIQNKIRVIVCTNAFGMGIDKPDVRVVLHADVPDSLENYYQEAGRAGRDGKTSYAVLLYDDHDLHELENAAALRYPSLQEIRQVYQSIANYLQIPTGAGEGQSYDFDITDYLKKFNLQGHTTLYALKTLEQEGWLSMSEQVFLPSSVRFTTDKNYLEEFERTHSQLEPLIKSLLRAYAGIYDQVVNISERQLTSLLKKDPELIKKELHELHQYGIIEYNPQKDSPQLFLLRDRIRAEELVVDMVAVNLRKERFQQRVRQMQLFVQETASCRSSIIGTYFGDTSLKPCGICDYCLRQKAIPISKEELELLSQKILLALQQGAIETKNLLLQLKSIKKEKVWKVINFLQAENKITVDKNGWIQLS